MYVYSNSHQYSALDNLISLLPYLHYFLIGTQYRTQWIVVNFVFRLTKCVSSWRTRSCSLRNTGRDWMTSCCRRRNWVWSWSSSLRSTKSKNWIKWTMSGVLESNNCIKWTMWGVQKSKNWVKCTKSKKQIELAGVPKKRTWLDVWKKKKVRSTKSKKEVRFIKRIRSGVKSENHLFVSDIELGQMYWK